MKPKRRISGCWIPGSWVPGRSGQLRHQYESLNVAQLRRNIDHLRNELFDLVEGKGEATPRAPRRGKRHLVGHSPSAVVGSQGQGGIRKAGQPQGRRLSL